MQEYVASLDRRITRADDAPAVSIAALEHGHTGDGVVIDLKTQLPWFTAAVRDIRMLRIEELNDLTPVVQRVAGLTDVNGVSTTGL